jgi:hypothetical protein
MEHADSSPDQVAKTVFWSILVLVAGFVIGIAILVR